MANYAIYETDTILNVIVANDLQAAIDATGLQAMETTGQPWIGWVFIDGIWTPPNEDPWIDAVLIDGFWAPKPPYPSWVWSGDYWEAPIPYPEGGLSYDWNESTQSWDLLDLEDEDSIKEGGE